MLKQETKHIQLSAKPSAKKMNYILANFPFY